MYFSDRGNGVERVGWHSLVYVSFPFGSFLDLVECVGIRW